MVWACGGQGRDPHKLKHTNKTQRMSRDEMVDRLKSAMIWSSFDVTHFRTSRMLFSPVNWLVMLRK